MKLTGFLLLAASNLILTATAKAEIRPHYGGTLHVAMRAAPSSLDPAQPDWFGSRNLYPLIFDTLVTLDERGRPQPALATSWEAEAGNQRWQFHLRQGAVFQDGAALTADAVAASLRAANPSWKVVSASNGVTIERDSAAPDLPAELALPRNSMVKRDSGKILGTGPFAIMQWDPAKKLVLAASEDYWGGRPFLDSIEIEMGKSVRDQMISFDLGRTQIIELAPEQAHSALGRDRRVESSRPLELVALVFTADAQSPEESKQREILSQSIDRKLLNTVVLQEGGEPAGGLLPDWMTGYSFLFPVEMDLTRAQQERAEIARADLWNLGFDVNDPVERVIAERIVLNARDAGLRLQLATQNPVDVRLVRVSLTSPNGRVALRGLCAALGLPQPAFGGDSVDDLYAAESALVKSRRVIPLLHLRNVTAVSERVRGGREMPAGNWPWTNVWLTPEQP